MMVGEGLLRSESAALLSEAGAAEPAWLPRERADVPDVMRNLDCFARPSLAEGISNTIREAMATCMPVHATEVGGNTELVLDGLSGHTVRVADMNAQAMGIVELASDPGRARSMGRMCQARVEAHFSLPAMVECLPGPVRRPAVRACTPIHRN